MNEHKLEPWEEEFDKKFKDSFEGGDMHSWESAGAIKQFIANQNTANAEMIRGLKIVTASTPHGSPYITGVNETAEAAARIVEK